MVANSFTIRTLLFQIMGNTIQMHVVTDAYATRVSNMNMYDVVRYGMRHTVLKNMLNSY